MLKKTLLTYLQHHHSDQFVKKWFEPLSIVPAENEGKRGASSNGGSRSENMHGDLSDFADAPDLQDSIAGIDRTGGRANQEEFIRVLFPHKLFGQWFMMHARREFENSVGQCLGEGARVEYVLDQNLRTHTVALPEQRKISGRKKSPFSFASFIASGDNYFALETAQGIARGNIDANIFNPFCLCGKSGCGKSHLLQSLAQELRDRNNHMVFFSTPKELSDIYRHGGSNYLTRQNILAHQAFILDDLQQARHKTELQDELVVLFDHFYTQGKTVAFGLNSLPEQLDGFIFPLITRLQRGVCAQLKQPDLELRSLFVRAKAENCGIPLNEKQVLTLATQFNSLRRLEGVINRATALTYAQGKKISDRDFERMIREAGGVALSEITSARIIEVCSEAFEVATTDILGSKRTKPVSTARQAAMYLCRDLLGSSFPELGNIFGGKDQSTAMYSVKKIEQLLKVDRDMHKLVTSLKTKCLGLRG